MPKIVKKKAPTKKSEPKQAKSISKKSPSKTTKKLPNKKSKQMQVVKLRAKEKTLGILGGLGPEATVSFLKVLMAKTTS